MLAHATAVVQAQQSIMVTGNSIAAGFNQPSYRLPLLDSLQARGCTVDMVGDQTLNSFDFSDPQSSPGVNVEPFTNQGGYDTDHQAFSGIQVPQLLSGSSSASYTVQPISAYTFANQPDFVLLHLGTSDLNQAIVSGIDTVEEINHWASKTAAGVEAVIDQIIASHYQPDELRILLANFVPYVGSFAAQSQRDSAIDASVAYTQKLESMVASKADERLLIVDVATDFDVQSMLGPDNIHPNSVGEQHIAGAFLPVLKGAGLCPANTPVVIAPSNGSIQSGDSVVINWADNGLAVDNWHVFVGDKQTGASSSYLDSGVLGSSVRSVVVSDLPAERSNVFVALHYQVDGIWDLSITSFISGDTPAGTSNTTEFVSGNEVAGLHLSARVAANDGLSAKPTMLQPVPGAQLPGTDVTFKWADNGVTLQQWYMRVGRTEGGAHFAETRITNPNTNQLRVTGLPSDGKTPVFVEFSYRSKGNWVTQDIEYLSFNSAGTVAQQQPTTDDGTVGQSDPNSGVSGSDNASNSSTPQLISPAAGTQLPGSAVTFKWDYDGVQVQQYYVRVGRSIGKAEYAGTRITNSNTRQLLVNGLPSDGATPVFVEFSYKTSSGAWVTQNVEYLASGSAGVVNQTPVAMDDIVGPVDIGARITFPVVANDTDSDGTVMPTSVEIVAQPSVGNAIVESDGRITYTHNGTVGTVQDVLKYTVRDDDGSRSQQATVRITPFNATEPEDQSPVASVDNPSLSTPLFKPIDISFDNRSWSGNAFDVVATATFVHAGSNTVRTGELFYAGDKRWTLRFTADRTGTWTYSTQSSDSELSNHSGTIVVTNSSEKGFVVAQGDKWVRSGTGKAFVPQYVMASSLDKFAADSRKIERDLNSFVDEHGFTGFHIRGYCQWFKLGSDVCRDISSSQRDPDFKSFEVVEDIIKQTAARGGSTHIWMYGDNARGQNPTVWGLNGTVDRRLQRYIAARLGALPGWTIGYGYDVVEWASPSQIASWYNYLDDRMMYPHLTGARSNKNAIMQHTEVLSYSAYEQHVPDYNRYVTAINDRSHKPSFSEDRFRVDAGFPPKDYSYEQTRRSMWQSAMAGGIANIWGNMQFSKGGTYNTGSFAYPNKNELKIYSNYIESHFRSDFDTCSSLSDGLCLKTPSNSEFLVYKENTRSITIDLRRMSGTSSFVATDTSNGSIRKGSFRAERQTWIAPYSGDWVLSIKR